MDVFVDLEYCWDFRRFYSGWEISTRQSFLTTEAGGEIVFSLEKSKRFGGIHPDFLAVLDQMGFPYRIA